jgi:hypothetical protein
MTRTTVLELLGNPSHRNLESSDNSDLMSQSTWSYGNDGRCSLLCDLAWIQYQINFDPEGKVTAKKRTVFTINLSVATKVKSLLKVKEKTLLNTSVCCSPTLTQ